MNAAPPVLSGEKISKRFGPVHALKDVSITVRRGRVTCLLGDNGAGKSTLIKVLSGVERPTAGSIKLAGETVQFHSPRDASDAGIATVYQDLGLVPIMPIYRNFVLGHEPVRRPRWLGLLSVGAAKKVASRELAKIGIEGRGVDRPVSTLSGGERQSLAIAKAVHRGARVLILDEPTSALGVREAAIVLRYVKDARARGVGIVLITHNVDHALPVGDDFVILNHGRVEAVLDRGVVDRAELTRHMGGGQELDELEGQLEDLGV
jgi:simple sugar transport system ATP-binding protein